MELITTPVGVKMATLVTIAMLKSTNANPHLAFTVGLFIF